MLPYLIYAPHYTHRSAGVRALYTLADELKARGADAVVFDWQSTANYPVGTDRIVIYPEVVSGNPLRAERVVRWVLNVPGKLGGDATYDPSEYVWTWQTSLYPTAPVLTVETLDRSLFYNDGRERTHDTFYVGKAKHRTPPITVDVRPLREAGVVEMTRRWPPTRAEVADLMRETRTLYTFDDFTAVIDEALLCGARVMVLPEGTEPKPLFPPTEVHAERIDAFLAATQERWG